MRYPYVSILLLSQENTEEMTVFMSRNSNIIMKREFRIGSRKEKHNNK